MYTNHASKRRHRKATKTSASPGEHTLSLHPLNNAHHVSIRSQSAVPAGRQRARYLGLQRGNRCICAGFQLSRRSERKRTGFRPLEVALPGLLNGQSVLRVAADFEVLKELKSLLCGNCRASCWRDRT